MREFGPQRQAGEPNSHYYLRWAKFCLAWAAGMALVLAVAIAGLLQRLEPGWSWACMVFLLLLGGFGLGMAALAALGYLISAGLARIAAVGPPPRANGYRRFVTQMFLLMLGWTILQGWAGQALLPAATTTEPFLPPPFSLLTERPQLCALWALGWLVTSMLILLAWAHHARRRYEQIEQRRLAAEQWPLVRHAIAQYESTHGTSAMSPAPPEGDPE